MANETILEKTKNYYKPEHLKELEKLEHQLRFQSFGSQEALALGGKILKNTEQAEKIAIQIIRVSDKVPIFQYVGNQAKERNLSFVQGKINTALKTEHSSFWALVAHHVGEITLTETEIHSQLPVSGAFPIKVGEELVAVVGLSGLKNGDDFHVLVAGMADYLSVQAEPFTGFLI